jgi:hypothetical protein
MNGQRAYRIKGSKQVLPKVTSSMTSSSSTILNGRRPVKYSDLIQREKKDQFLHSIIEEHMIKFGYSDAFDIFANEYQEKDALASSPVHRSQTIRRMAGAQSLSEIKTAIFRVVLY